MIDKELMNFFQKIAKPLGMDDSYVVTLGCTSIVYRCYLAYYSALHKDSQYPCIEKKDGYHTVYLEINYTLDDFIKNYGGEYISIPTNFYKGIEYRAIKVPKDRLEYEIQKML